MSLWRILLNAADLVGKKYLYSKDVEDVWSVHIENTFFTRFHFQYRICIMYKRQLFNQIGVIIIEKLLDSSFVFLMDLIRYLFLIILALQLIYRLINSKIPLKLPRYNQLKNQINHQVLLKA